MKLSRNDWIGISLISLALVILGGVGFYVISAKSKKSDVDEVTFCKKDSAALKRHIVVLIDKTDPYTPNQEKLVREVIQNAKKSLEQFDKISMLLIEPNEATPITEEFSLCSPLQSDNVSPLFQNPRLIQKKYDEAFGKPLNEVLNNLQKIPTGNLSPIMEAVLTIGQRDDFSPQVAKRELFVFSDMLQNSSLFSDYRGHKNTSKKVSELIKNNEIFKNAADFKNTNITIYYVARSDQKKKQDKKHLEFWSDILKNFGATNVVFKKI